MCFSRIAARARHARRDPRHRRFTWGALLGSVAVPLCAAGGAHAEPVYETVVTAEPVTAQPREDRAAASSVITQERTARAGESLPEVLSEQAGAAVTRLGGLGAIATLSLRGSTANQVLVYVDGVPLNTATGGGVDLGAVPLGDISRIEIYRGTSPIGFGASAIGGVVSLTTAVPRDNQALFQADAGSFGRYESATRAAWNDGPLHLYTGAHVATSTGDFAYVNSKGSGLNVGDDERTTRRNNDLKQLDGIVRGELDLAKGRKLRASAMVFERQQGLPGPGPLERPVARLGTFRLTGTAAYESDGDFGPGSRVRATAYGNYLLSHFDDQSYQINGKPTDSWDRTYTTGGTVDWRRPLVPWLALALVADGRYDRFVPADARARSLTGAPGTRLFGAAGGELDLWLRPLQLDAIASLRVEAARERTSGRDNFSELVATQDAVDHVLPIARLSLIEAVTSWLDLRGNFGHYARLPSLVELYGNTGYLLGNIGLRPERGLNVDLGPVVSWRHEATQLHWATAVFASWPSDLISYKVGGGRARAENVGSARILGVESSVSLAVGPLRVIASATITDARDTTDRPTYHDRQLPLRPRYRCYARPEWRDIAVLPSVSLGLYADVDATAGNFLDGANVFPVAARLFVGAGLYATLPAHFSVRLSGRNLTDAAAYDLADYPLPGRELAVSLAWSAAQP